MAKNPPISPEDSALFRESVGTVRPLNNDKVDLTPPHTAPVRRRPRNSDEPQVVIQDAISDDYQPAEDSQSSSGVGFVRPGIQQGVLRKLRRGQFPAEAELDLHGLTVAKARTALLHFLQMCRDRGVRHVRIIHGQGNSSREGRPVLKGKVHLWLQQLDEVLAFCPARPEHGGAGALYVLLKRH
jgi:DNA-nicking Smr family endonuclease